MAITVPQEHGPLRNSTAFFCDFSRSKRLPTIMKSKGQRGRSGGAAPVSSRIHAVAIRSSASEAEKVLYTSLPRNSACTNAQSDYCMQVILTPHSGSECKASCTSSGTVWLPLRSGGARTTRAPGGQTLHVTAASARNTHRSLYVRGHSLRMSIAYALLMQSCEPSIITLPRAFRAVASVHFFKELLIIGSEPVS